jgi:hypothetical protein
MPERHRRSRSVSRRAPAQPELNSATDALRDLARAYRAACKHPGSAPRWTHLDKTHRAVVERLTEQQLVATLDAQLAAEIAEWHRQPEQALEILRTARERDWDLELALLHQMSFKPGEFDALRGRVAAALRRSYDAGEDDGETAELAEIDATSDLVALLDGVRESTWLAFGFDPRNPAPPVRLADPSVAWVPGRTRRGRKRKTRKIARDQALVAVFLVGALVGDAGFDVFALSYALALGAADASSNPAVTPGINLRKLLEAAA